MVCLFLQLPYFFLFFPNILQSSKVVLLCQSPRCKKMDLFAGFFGSHILEGCFFSLGIPSHFLLPVAYKSVNCNLVLGNSKQWCFLDVTLQAPVQGAVQEFQHQNPIPCHPKCLSSWCHDVLGVMQTCVFHCAVNDYNCRKGVELCSFPRAFPLMLCTSEEFVLLIFFF